MADLRPDMLWRALVEAIDDGLLVLDDEDSVIYANQAAADLLNYQRADLLALDRDDVLALCQPHRLDVERLATVLAQDLLGPKPVGTYRVVTQQRRLLVSPFALDMAGGRYRCLLVREDLYWRSDLIADAVMRELPRPLSFTMSYTNALINRMQSPDPDATELAEFAKIIRGGVAGALEQWEHLHALYQTDPRRTDGTVGEPVSLEAAVSAALAEWRSDSRAVLPGLEMSLPPDLPPVRVRPAHLREILIGLLREAAARQGERRRLKVAAERKADAVQVSIALEGEHGLVRAHLFDSMPLSAVEQIVMMYGGRLWVEGQPGGPSTFAFTLPL